MRSGPNLEATARLARALAPCPVIASGGVSRLEDLDALVPTGATAVVVGKALYEGVFTVEQAWPGPAACQVVSKAGDLCPWPSAMGDS